MRRSNQLNYEATDVRNWSFVGSRNVPVRNESTMTYHFIVDSFLMGTLEPRNDQLPKLEMSTNFEFELHMDSKSGSPHPPPPLSTSLLVKDVFFFFCKRVSDGTYLNILSLLNIVNKKISLNVVRVNGPYKLASNRQTERCYRHRIFSAKRRGRLDTNVCSTVCLTNSCNHR